MLKRTFVLCCVVLVIVLCLCNYYQHRAAASGLCWIVLCLWLCCACDCAGLCCACPGLWLCCVSTISKAHGVGLGGFSALASLASGGEFVNTILASASASGLAVFRRWRGLGVGLGPPIWTEVGEPSVFKIYSYAYRKYQKTEKHSVNY